MLAVPDRVGLVGLGSVEEYGAAAVRHIREWLEGRHIRTAGLFGSWFYIWSDRAYASGATLAAALPR